MKTLKNLKWFIIALISILTTLMILIEKNTNKSEIEVFKSNTRSGRKIMYGVEKDTGKIILLDEKKLEFIKNTGVEVIEK